MNKVIVIHQPDFIPYLGFFHKILHCDYYVIFDCVQFLRRGFHHRDKIKTPEGEQWLTISINKCPQNTLINDVYLSNKTNWRKNHINLISQNYNKSDYFDEIFPYIQKIYEFNTDKLGDFNINSLNILFELFNINKEIILASNLKPKGNKNHLLIDIINKVNGNVYLSGIGAQNYFESAPFLNANIEIMWQNFKHPVYQQLYGKFIPNLSSIDLLFNCGILKSREILRSC